MADFIPIPKKNNPIAKIIDKDIFALIILSEISDIFKVPV